MDNDIKNWYLSNFKTFESTLNGNGNTSFEQVRTGAITCFEELGFPTPKNEDWKYTNISPILKHKYSLANKTPSVSLDLIKKLTFEGVDTCVMTQVNGQIVSGFSDEFKQDGVIVTDFQDAFKNHADLLNSYLGKYSKFEAESFTALNTAFVKNGIFIFVPDNTTVEQTIHILHLSDGAFVSHPRNLFVVEKNSSVKIIETFYALSDEEYFTNCVSEVVLGENAFVDHLKIQDESKKSYHISNVQIHQQANSNYSATSIDLGGKLVRNNLNVILNDKNCETHLYGFFLGTGTQHIDNHTFVDHAMPHCFSNELYKGILDDKSTGVFNGKIIVRPDAQKTNALQSNKTLLLTDDASINAKPQLEIFADDVKCTHGATIGQLDDEALFYLRARGIRKEMAHALLRHAFMSDVLENVKDDALRKQLDDLVFERFTEKELAG